MESAKAQFKLGDCVSVRNHGKAVIVNKLVQDPSSERHGRYQVQYLEDGSTYWVLPSQLRLFPKPPARVLVAETTNHYRSAALLYTHPDDVVLEVGCHEGVTTEILHRRCKWVMGIDIAQDPLSRAKARYPHVDFKQVDGFDTGQLKALSPTGTYDKIYIDIGGIAELHIVMSLVGLYFRTFKRAVLVVKNRYFKGLLGNTQVFVPPQQLEDKQRAAAKKQQQQQQQSTEQQQQQQHLQCERQQQACAGCFPEEQSGKQQQIGSHEQLEQQEHDRNDKYRQEQHQQQQQHSSPLQGTTLRS